MFYIGMICILLSGPLFLLGIGGLMSSDLHLEYGVKTKPLFKIYCFAFIFLALVLAITGEFILS